MVKRGRPFGHLVQKKLKKKVLTLPKKYGIIDTTKGGNKNENFRLARHSHDWTKCI